MESPYDFRFILVSLERICEALPTTMLLTLIPLFVGILLGLCFAIIRRFQIPFLAAFLRHASKIFKGIPAILLVLMTNYLVLKPIDYLAQYHTWAQPLQSLNKIYIGIIALSIYAVVQVSETFLSALLAIDNGQYEAAYSIGLSRRQALKRIVIPQAVPVALPMLCNNVIGILKSTSIVYLISVNDILSAAMNSASVNFRYLEAYIAAALVYWALCFLIERSFMGLEKSFKKAAGGAG